jgi:transposase InsO family protein
MADPLRPLRQLSNELGHPGVAGLWLAAQRKGLAVSKKQVEAFVRQKGEKQIFQAVQPARGKSVAESLDARWQMDLIVYVNQPVAAAGKTFRYVLFCVNVFDRYVYGEALQTKEPKEVKVALEKILGYARKKPKIISSDQGQEFQKDVVEFLANKGIAHKLKDVGDVNGLAVLDKNMQSLKQKIAQLVTGGGTWLAALPRAVAAQNNTPKTGVLHGATPKEVRDDDTVHMMLLQDNAAKMKHNMAQTGKKTAALEDTGSFRAPLPESTGKFKRSFHATYGESKQVASVRGGTVTDTQGTKYPLKSIKVIPVGSSAAEQRLAPNEQGPAKKRQLGGSIITALALLLEEEEGEKMSISKAAALLKQALRLNGQDYNEVLKKSRAGRLIDLIRLASDRFTLVEQPHGPQTWYYVSLV